MLLIVQYMSDVDGMSDVDVCDGNCLDEPNDHYSIDQTWYYMKVYYINILLSKCSYTYLQ